MPNPWDNDPIVSSGPVYGVPRLPSPQTAPQAEKDKLDVIRTTQQITAQPLQNANTQLNIAQGQQSMANTTFTQKDKLRSDFQALPPVKKFQDFIPEVFKAVQAPDNAQGDLAVLYSFAKAMDPTTGVREGEQAMARNTASLQEQAQVWINRVNAGERLPPNVRANFIETMRETGKQYAKSYDQQREFYTDLAKRNKFDPNEIVGPHAFAPFLGVEKNYIISHGGIPKAEGVPLDTAPQTVGEGDIGFNKPREDPNPYTPEQVAAYDAFVKANPQATREQFTSFLQSVNIQATPESVDRTLEAMHKGGRFDPSLSTLGNARYNTDITDVRGAGVGDDQINAAARGAGDVATFGTLDKLRAGIATIRDGGTFDQNLAREYAISDYDAEKHPYARLAGQAIGGFAVPMGEIRTVPQLVAKGMGLGAAYATGSSRSLADVPQNALLGAVSGAAVPAALVGAGRGIGAIRGAMGRAPAEVPPLVDPVTGELNTPMDAMRPAERVQTMQDYGLKTITPGMAGGRSARIGEQVLNNLPASAGHMEDIYSTAGRELRRSMQGEAQKFGASKTLNEGGGEVQRGANEWVGRAEEVDRKVYNAIPIHPEAPTTNTSTVNFLQASTSKFQSNPKLQEELKDPALARYLIAIQEHGLNWQDLKDFRSFVGAKAGQFRFSKDPLKEEYGNLYRALSEDMRASASAQGPRALRAFERANTFHARMENRIEGALVQILGNDAKAAPERAAATIQAMTQGGKAGGDLGKLAQIKASTVKSGAWDEIASTLIHLGGQPAKSEGRAFEPRTFVNWYADMSEKARQLLFKPELRKSLDGFVAMNQQLSRVRALNNNSNTGPLVLGGAQLLQFGKMIMSADLTGMAIQIGANAANYALGKFWTTPKAVSILTGLGRAAAKGDQNGVKSQIGRLTKLATTNG